MTPATSNMLVVDEPTHVATWNALRNQLDERLADIEEEFREEGIAVSDRSRNEMWRLVEHVYKDLDIRDPRPALFGKNDGTFSVSYFKKATGRNISFDFEASGQFYRIWTGKPAYQVEGPFTVVADPTEVSHLILRFLAPLTPLGV